MRLLVFLAALLGATCATAQFYSTSGDSLYAAWDAHGTADYYVLYVYEYDAPSPRRAGATCYTSMMIPLTEGATDIGAVLYAYDEYGTWLDAVLPDGIWPNGEPPPPVEGLSDEYYFYRAFADSNYGFTSHGATVGELNLYENHFGSEFRFLTEEEAPGNFWLHESVNSAAIAFSANMPSAAWIEYSEDMTFSASSDTSVDSSESSDAPDPSLTFSALGPLSPWTTSKVTLSSSFTLAPASSPLSWKKYSFPSSADMNPNLFSLL